MRCGVVAHTHTHHTEALHLFIFQKKTIADSIYLINVFLLITNLTYARLGLLSLSVELRCRCD